MKKKNKKKNSKTAKKPITPAILRIISIKHNHKKKQKLNQIFIKIKNKTIKSKI